MDEHARLATIRAENGMSASTSPCKDAPAQLAAVIASSHDALVTRAADGTTVGWNAAADAAYAAPVQALLSSLSKPSIMAYAMCTRGTAAACASRHPALSSMQPAPLQAPLR